MKRITILFFIMFTVLIHSQQKKFTQTGPQKLNKEQHHFIKSINEYYPEFSLDNAIRNVLDEKKQITESYLEFKNPPNDCDDYLITVQSDNKQLDYEFDFGAGNGNAIFKGTVYLFGVDVYKTELVTKAGKLFFTLYKNGKEVFSENPYKGLN
ncbi:hypothetical protein OIU80_19080 [Flavobacterium sp. LS1R47]|jgi:hypothetical protein|uniref:Uncharacterized protein n=1 Tax=Flavobacterium frigoritolerans TaxID=2987686 RepID=A0A9X3HNY0_9FLAO|nr:hypothetical protein [Flavobacterium frigoritolerans]MCV9934388.1 hypothetical protein [Flavobacterium frigoritolerans]